MNYSGENFDKIHIFQEAPYGSIKNILDQCPVREMACDELLLEPGQDNQYCFVVLAGRLTLHLNSVDSFPTAEIQLGECVGELSIIDDKKPTAFIKADCDTRLLVLDKATFWFLVSTSQYVARNLLQLFSSRMRFNTEALVESLVIQTVPDIIYRLDSNGRFTFLNDSVQNLGYTPEELCGKHFTELIAHEDVERVSYDRIIEKIRKQDKFDDPQPKLFDERRAQDRKTAGLEVRLKLKEPQESPQEGAEQEDSSNIIADVSCTGIRQSEGYTGTIGIIRDITERKRLQRQVEEQKMRMESIFDTAHDAIVVFNDQGTVESFNKAACAMFGYDEQEMQSLKAEALVDRSNPKSPADRPWMQLVRGEGFHHKNRSHEDTALRKGGESFPMEYSVSEVRLKDRAINTAIIRDITDRKKAEMIIYRQANYDALTDLPNRSLFMKTLEERFNQVQENDQGMALMFIDLDRFKWINDNLGHPAGDALLQMSAQRLLDVVGEEDVVARLGGDEFVAIVMGPRTVDDVTGLAHTILDQLNEAFVLDGKEAYISGSLGIALYPQDCDSHHADLLKLADEAMYRSKHAGKNAFNFYSGENHIRKKNYDASDSGR
ncbi:MAG: diguanylate cyclase [Magnetococcales bacterium]|nr:diguanylate cyclase [Magnetococcales bacterium]